MSNLSMLPGGFYPLQNELLSSWVSRLALNHRMSPIVFWKAMSPVNHFKIESPNHHYYDMDLYPISETIDALASRTLTSERKVYKTMLEYDYNQFRNEWLTRSRKIQSTYTWLLRFETNNRHKIRPSFCAGCFQKDATRPYMRKLWRFSFNVACLNCGLLLNNTCPRCNSGIDYRLLSYKSKNRINHFESGLRISICYVCGYDLAQLPTRPAAAAVLRQQQILQNMNQKYSFFPDDLVHRYFNTLRTIINTLISFTIHQNVDRFPSPFILDHNYGLDQNNCTFESWPIEVRARFLFQAMLFLQDGEEDFNKALTIYSKRLTIHHFIHLNYLKSFSEILPKDWMKNWSPFA